MAALKNYLLGIVQDGDYMNDWLTHLPHWFQSVVLDIHHSITFLYDGIHSFFS